VVRLEAEAGSEPGPGHDQPTRLQRDRPPVVRERAGSGAGVGHRILFDVRTASRAIAAQFHSVPGSAFRPSGTRAAFERVAVLPWRGAPHALTRSADRPRRHPADGSTRCREQGVRGQGLAPRGGALSRGGAVPSRSGLELGPPGTLAPRVRPGPGGAPGAAEGRAAGLLPSTDAVPARAGARAPRREGRGARAAEAAGGTGVRTTAGVSGGGRGSGGREGPALPGGGGEVRGLRRALCAARLTLAPVRLLGGQLGRLRP